MTKKLWQLFNREESVRGASLILIITLTGSNILGLFRDRFLARNISFSDLDIYFAAFRIPDTLFNFLVLGAISSAFIPIFSDFIANKKTREGFRLVNLMFSTAALLMVLVAIGFYFMMPQALAWVVPDFSAERFLETVKLARILMLTPIFFAISYIIGGVLNSHQRFLAYALAPLMYNLAIIVGAVWVAPRFGLIGVVWSVLAGSVLHAAIQVPALIKIGYRWRFVLDFSDVQLRRIGRLMLPRSLSLGFNQVLLTIYTSIASSLAAGAIAAFSFSNNIQTVPVVILGNSFATAIFPTLAHRIARKDEAGFVDYLSQTIRVIGFLLVPATVIFILFRAQIVRLILGSGKVGWEDTKMTAVALGFFSISLLAQGLIPLLARAFFAIKNTRTPMYISLVSVAISIIIAYPLSSRFSIAGLALAFSLGSFVQAILLFSAMSRIYPKLWSAKLVISLLRTAFISLAMGGFVWLTMHAMANIVDMTRYWGVLAQTATGLLVGAGIYFGVNKLFNSEELGWVFTPNQPTAGVGHSEVASESVVESAANQL
ncbi:MAG: murein biosynthesis integral membrane protein MurJ [Patescibacteria group bacterium]|mgnify:CR=1 FL=1